MFKKIFLILFCSIIFFLAEKGDPEYQGQIKQIKIIKLI